jgi:hypothetical protein
MNKVKILEENRNHMISLNNIGAGLNTTNYLHSDSDKTNKSGNIEEIKLLLIELIGAQKKDVEKSLHEEKLVMKKDLFINSINRDWGLNKEINNLKLNIGIDIKNFYIEPDLILLPTYIKKDVPYIVILFSDNAKTQSYNFIFNKNNGNWDEWININKNIEPININSKNWKITFYDNRNNELFFYKDDIDIIEVRKESDNFKLKLSEQYKYHNIQLNDVILIKTNDYKNHNKKIISIENDEIVINDINDYKEDNDNNRLKIEDFVNSKILVIKDQFTINLKYYSKLYH